MIKDIYHWRLQTTLAIVAGYASILRERTGADRTRIPGAPLWLAAIYSDKFAKMNKYWLPAMW